VLAMSDVALNPMRLGSGTNLKMLEYAAAGLPIITTPHGVRGLSLQDDRHLRVVEQGDFAEALRDVVGQGRSEAEYRALEARRFVEREYDWRIIAEQWRESLEQLGEFPG
jgi:glycosyltransferase involved in cell wall biosynthesis